MINKPYSKVGVLHLTLLQFSLSYILKNSYRCVFPCVVVKKSNHTVLNICENTVSVYFNTDSGTATISGFRILPLPI